MASGDVNRLKAWWIFRMLGSPDPLGERLTLMWHDHFATAQSKVEDLALMRRQNDTFRRLARAPFGELLERLDPGAGPACSTSTPRATARTTPTRTSPAS